MSAMPGMEKEEKGSGKPIDLAIVMGGKPKAGADAKEPLMSKSKEDDHDDLPAGFEEAFSEAFPDAAGDKDRMMALKRLIGTCTDSDY